MLIKNDGVFIMHEKKCEFSWWEDNKEMTKVNSGALYYTFGTSGINYEMAQHFKSVAWWKKRKKLTVERHCTVS